MSRSHARGHHSAAEETIASLAAAGSANGAVLVTQDIPLATLQAAGGVSTASFNVGPVLPAGARVFTSTIDVTFVQAFASSAGGIVHVGTQITGGNAPAVALPSPENLSNNTGTFGAISSTYVQLCSNQGGQQLSVELVLPTGNFNQLTAGHVQIAFLYTVP